jgi:iron complex transport system ATP-binding protein
LTALVCDALTIAAGARVLVRDLSLSLARGEFLAILGRNGCGKSLTLHALAGLSTPRAGRVLLQGAEVRTLPRRLVARQLGLLPQDREESLAMTALESVLIGRHPHLSFWQREGTDDLAIAHSALTRLGLHDIALRLVTSLSGGEQRRVAMAALLAQAPQIYLLDEPSNHLDPLHQIQVLKLFRDLTSQGASIIATLHDPTLADRFADRVLLLHGDGRHRLGSAAEILTSEALSDLYLTPMQTLGVAPRRAFLPI